MQLFKNVSNLLARAKQPDKPDELKAFCLTGMSRKERLNAIVQSMDKFYYQYGGIQLVVIDGIADLVKSANDEAESVAVIPSISVCQTTPSGQKNGVDSNGLSNGQGCPSTRSR